MTFKNPATFLLLCACLALAGCRSKQDSPAAAGSDAAAKKSGVPALGQAAADKVAQAIAEPTIDEIVKGLTEAAEKPRRLRHVTEKTSQLTSPFSELGTAVRTTMTSETWSDEHGRVRSEITLTVNTANPTHADATVNPADSNAPAVPEHFASESKMLMVGDKQKMWSYVGPPIDHYSEMDLTDPAARQPWAEDQYQMMLNLLKEIVSKYDIQYDGQLEVAGRHAYSLSATPKDPLIRGKLMNLFSFNSVKFTADTETWHILSMQLDGQMEFPHGKPGVADIVTPGADADQQVIQMHMNMTTKEFDPNPDLPDELFTFVPPPGAKKIDVPPMSGTSPFGALGGAGGAQGEGTAGKGTVGDESAKP